MADQGMAFPPGAAVDLSGYARLTDLPQAASVTPPPVNSAGSAGSAVTYSRSDHTHVSSVFKTIRTTPDATGVISWTYPAGFFVAAPVIELTVEATSGQPMLALLTSNTTTGGSAQILRAQTLPASLTLITQLVSFNVFGGTVPTGTRLHIFAATASV